MRLSDGIACVCAADMAVIPGGFAESGYDGLQIGFVYGLCSCGNVEPTQFPLPLFGPLRQLAGHCKRENLDRRLFRVAATPFLVITIAAERRGAGNAVDARFLIGFQFGGAVPGHALEVRKSVVMGKSASVRVDLVGQRLITT